MEKAGRGTILHDGWSKNGVHYIAVFACFMKEVSEYRDKVEVSTLVPELVLLACSPMASLSNDPTDTLSDKEKEEEDDKEAVKFTAEVHANFIKEIFKFYTATDSQTWIKAQTANNGAVNQKIASLLNIIHVLCNNYLLNSEVNYMNNRSHEFRQVLESIQDTMRQCKQSLKNAAVLRNLCKLKSLYNKIS